MNDTSQYGHARCFNDWFLNVRELVEMKLENKPFNNDVIRNSHYQFTGKHLAARGEN